MSLALIAIWGHVQGWIKEDFFQKKIFFLLLIKEDFSVIREDFQSLKIMITS